MLSKDQFELETTKNEGSHSQQTRKKRRLESATLHSEIPKKTQRRDERLFGNATATERLCVDSCLVSAKNNKKCQELLLRRPNNEVVSINNSKVRCSSNGVLIKRHVSGSQSKFCDEKDVFEKQDVKVSCWAIVKREMQEQIVPAPISRITRSEINSRGAVIIHQRDETARLRKTIQWLEENAKKLREDIANVRTELHEKEKATKIAKREMDAAIKEARFEEATKYQMIIAELKIRCNHTHTNNTTGSTSPLSQMLKVDLAKEENHKREIAVLKKRLEDAENLIRILKWESLNQKTKPNYKIDNTFCIEVRRLKMENRNLRVNNGKLEEKLRTHLEAERVHATELRIQHENHEMELSALRKSLRSETMKMMGELRRKNHEIEKLSKLVNVEKSQKRRKTIPNDVITMRRLRENKENGPLESFSIEKKLFKDDCHTVDSYVSDINNQRVISEVEVERLREFAIEQQEFIESLRQALKEKERKLEQLSNKRRKEEFYRQWLELEPVAEVEDEEDHEEGDSALSSAPSSLSPQPGGCEQWQNNGVTREAYEAMLIEVEELQTKLLEERQELFHAKSQVTNLEKILQEIRHGERNKESNILKEKLREAEEREESLQAELSELREQNELLEFRLLELEETSIRRESPEYTADNGIVLPELMHLHKEPSSKQRSRAVATVIPYTNNVDAANIRPTSPITQKPPLSLQESGIFEHEDEDEDEDADHYPVEFTSCSTQTELPSGELLQEVQRLQELRARIQERSAKVISSTTYPVDLAKNNCGLESVNDDSVDSIVHLSFCQERIRDLEARVAEYVEAEKKQLQERRIIKQREEELLDENYKLTERVYWLENELRNAEYIMKHFDSTTTFKKVENKEKQLPVEANNSALSNFKDDETLETTDPLMSYSDNAPDVSLIDNTKPDDSRFMQDTNKNSNKIENNFQCNVDTMIENNSTMRNSLELAKNQLCHEEKVFNGTEVLGNMEDMSIVATGMEKNECNIKLDKTNDIEEEIRLPEMVERISDVLFVQEEEKEKEETRESQSQHANMSETETEKKVIYFRWR